MEGLGRILILAGLLLALVGGAIAVLGPDRLGWFGRLPGDVRIERPGFRFYFSFTTLILVSVALNLLLWIVLRLRR